MYFKVSNQQHIKRILESNPTSEDIKEIVLNVRDVNKLLDELLENIETDSSWPLAVPPTLIVDQANENQIKVRAKNIVDMTIEQDVFGLNMLDFGCGSGHVTAELGIRMARKVVGYDIVTFPSWESLSKDQLIFTNDWKVVLENAPYDHILLYDVIDHVMNQEPVEILQTIKKVLARGGIITMRCHPWISRHGAHLYYNLNRAFAHVIFDEAKLKLHGYEAIPTRKVIHPMWSYKKWIEKAGLNIVKEDKIQEPAEDYFLKNDMFKNLINLHFKNSPMEEFREGKGDLNRVLSFHFIDFTLSH